MELNELHIFDRHTRTIRHRDTVAGVGHRVGGVIEGLTETTGREDDTISGFESLDISRFNVICNSAVTGAVSRVWFVGDGKPIHIPLVVHLNPALDRLLVHGVEQLVASLGTSVRCSWEG